MSAFSYGDFSEKTWYLVENKARVLGNNGLPEDKHECYIAINHEGQGILLASFKYWFESQSANGLVEKELARYIVKLHNEYLKANPGLKEQNEQKRKELARHIEEQAPTTFRDLTLEQIQGFIVDKE